MHSASLIGVSLGVQDVDRSAEFYAKIPGAEKLEHRPGEYALFRIGEGRVSLHRMNGRPFHLELNVDDVQAARASLSESGLGAEGGDGELLLRDPDGNLLELGRQPHVPDGAHGVPFNPQARDEDRGLG